MIYAFNSLNVHIKKYEDFKCPCVTVYLCILIPIQVTVASIITAGNFRTSLFQPSYHENFLQNSTEYKEFRKS
jgi:hypothetical protein